MECLLPKVSDTLKVGEKDESDRFSSSLSQIAQGHMIMEQSKTILGRVLTNSS